MKIMFDSNVWQIVTIPSDFIDEPLISDFRKIRQAIVDKKIIPFISETVFTIEAIRKVERQDFFSKQNPKVSVKEEANGNSISMSFTIGPNEKDAIDFIDRPILKKYFDEAIELGFNIVRLPRIGGLVNKEIEQKIYHLDDATISEYHEKVFEVAQKIEDNGGGMKQIETIGLQYGGPNWLKGLKNAPETDRNKVAKAAAEWADGDSVAISIAIGCDYFCTRDQAKGAGNKSVLSAQNLVWLNTDYHFKTILPENLSKLL